MCAPFVDCDMAVWNCILSVMSCFLSLANFFYPNPGPTPSIHLPGRSFNALWRSLCPAAAPTAAAAAAATKQFVLAFNCHTVLASGGLSLMVPFFGSDDDVAALLLALAIVARDTSAEVVVLSFLEPENPATRSRAAGGSRQEVGFSRQTNGSGGAYSLPCMS